MGHTRLFDKIATAKSVHFQVDMLFSFVIDTNL